MCLKGIRGKEKEACERPSQQGKIHPGAEVAEARRVVAEDDQVAARLGVRQDARPPRERGTKCPSACVEIVVAGAVCATFVATILVAADDVATATATVLIVRWLCVGWLLVVGCGWWLLIVVDCFFSDVVWPDLFESFDVLLLLLS